MTEKDILRAMSGIDSALILDAERIPKKNNWLKWAGVAAGFCLIVYLGFMMKIAFTGASAPGPTNFYYDSFAEMNAAIGKDTLYNDNNTAFAESETISISISCYEDENGNVTVAGGGSAVTDEHINSLIDAKLAGLELAPTYTGEVEVE